MVAGGPPRLGTGLQSDSDTWSKLRAVAVLAPGTGLCWLGDTRAKMTLWCRYSAVRRLAGGGVQLLRRRTALVCASLIRPVRNAKGMDWREYQHAAAEFFAGLGMSADVEAEVNGSRVNHKVDVAVSFSAYGVEHQWLVECKFWKSRVPKEKVMALKAIVDDVGADRGFLLSENGFQSGATTAARFSSITLTNLADLRANAEADFQAIRWQELYGRMATCRVKSRELWVVTHQGAHGGSSQLKTGVSSDDFYFHIANLGLIEDGLERAQMQRVPISYRYEREGNCVRAAPDVPQFLERASTTLDEIEAWMDEQVAKPWPNKPKPALGRAALGATLVRPEDD